MKKDLKNNAIIRKIIGEIAHDTSTPIATLRMAGLHLKRQMPALLKLYNEAIERGEEVPGFDHKTYHLMEKVGDIISNKSAVLNTLLNHYTGQINTLTSKPVKLNSNATNPDQQSDNDDKKDFHVKPNNNNPHILLVDDETFNLEIESEVLLEMGCEVDTATSGKQALDLIKDNTYDLVFMDCYMSDPDGFETTRQIRAKEQTNGWRLPIIGLTASLLEEDKTHAFEAGMDDFVTRPISIELFKNFLKVKK